jgi:hypothetical protein
VYVESRYRHGILDLYLATLATCHICSVSVIMTGLATVLTLDNRERSKEQEHGSEAEARRCCGGGLAWGETPWILHVTPGDTGR